MRVGSFFHCIRYAAIAGIVLGCGEPLAPLPSELTRTTAGAFAEARPEQAPLVRRRGHLSRDLVRSETITAAGGTISIPRAGLTVIFPAGAIEGSLRVTITAHRGDEVAYSFEPHGVRFARPVIVIQHLAATTYVPAPTDEEPQVKGGYLERGLADVDASGVGVFAETFRAEYRSRDRRESVYFSTTHFSGYALASGCKPKAEEVVDAVTPF
jgi:hypothetical protein